MEIAFQAARALSVIAFTYYGLFCLFSPSMVVEFERYGLARLRMLTGGAEVLGALGLLAGVYFSPLVVVAAGGLCLLMLAGLFTRVRIGDPPLAMLPALVLFLVNLFVLVYAILRARS